MFASPCVALAVACGDGDSIGTSTSITTTDAESSSTSTTDAESTSSTTEVESADTTTVVAEPLVIDCADPPLAAVGASYSHTVSSSGGTGGVLWTISGLPPGLTFLNVTGAMYGIPEEEGTYDVEVTAEDDTSSITEVCTITVGPSFSIDFGALGKPCIEAGDDLLMYAAGGDGAMPTCVTPGGSGNASPPPGVTVNPATCMIEGAIEEGYGTWVWITEVVQSDFTALVPFCATQDVPPVGSYGIDGDHSGLVGNVLAPAVGTFAADAPISWGGNGDPIVRVTGPCGSGGCYHAIYYTIGASPFDDTSASPIGTLDDANGDPIGLTHELSASGPPVPESFASRPWVLNWNLTYCLATDATSCADQKSAETNSMGSLHFGTIMMPE